VAVIWLLVTQGHGAPSHEASPREILDRRLARGEISQDEHSRLREALEQPSAQTASHA
jgi:uncharacterized membrane protein